MNLSNIISTLYVCDLHVQKFVLQVLGVLLLGKRVCEIVHTVNVVKMMTFVTFDAV